MAYSARIMPQSYILLLRPYYARNSAGRMCKGLLGRLAGVGFLILLIYSQKAKNVLEFITCEIVARSVASWPKKERSAL